MSKAGILRALLTQRLTEVVEEICGLFETAIAEYEDIVSRSKEEAEQQRKLLEAVVSAGVDLHKTDIKQLFSVKEEQQEWRSIMNQNTPELPNFKKEPEEYSSSQEGPLSSTFAGVHVKSASQKGPQEYYPHVLKVFPGNINQLMICKEEAPSEQQEGRTTLKEGDPGHPLIEEEQRTPWSSQEGKWNGEDKEKAHQRQTEENRESPASSSAQQMETDIKDRGRAEPCLQSDSEKTLNSSDSATEDSDDDWERMPKLHEEPLLRNLLNGSASDMCNDKASV
ncbi:hypothetical protein EXN66_Car004897 [Channa argus]|uniref:Uncharacterized protein n=1 Tax=Channa argus TaxID=215402 RepID=A0A6G1PG24_CHAAH|nr:hypothetical protein EXN66_Car004897 [Channa argus]